MDSSRATIVTSGLVAHRSRPQSVYRQVLDKQANAELKAFIFDAYGLYYLRRGKSTAALDYVQKAMKTHARMQVSDRENVNVLLSALASTLLYSLLRTSKPSLSLRLVIVSSLSLGTCLANIHRAGGRHYFHYFLRPVDSRPQFVHSRPHAFHDGNRSKMSSLLKVESNAPPELATEALL